MTYMKVKLARYANYVYFMAYMKVKIDTNVIFYLH